MSGPSLRSWNDALAVNALQVVAESVTEFAGFELASILVRRGDVMESVAVAGDAKSAEKILGRRTAVRLIHELIPRADDWGLLKFVPDDRVAPDAQRFGVVVTGDWDDPEPPAESWRSCDLLFAPLYDHEGELRGLLSVDRPRDRCRPGPEQRRVLERFTPYALRAVLSALESEDLAHRVKMADTARRVVRTATTRASLADIVADCRQALIEGYLAREAWVHVFDETLLEGPSSTLVGARDATAEVASAVVRFATAAWSAQQVLRVTADDSYGLSLDHTDQDISRRFLDERRIGSMMVIPLGAAEECLGALMLSRGRQDAEWSPIEAATALDLGHDLGRALLNLRTLAQHEHLVARLRAVDSYKDELISTISHELRTPLTSILGNLELLELEDLTTSEFSGALAAADRGARRLVTTVDDLLLLSRMKDPDAQNPFKQVDLRQVALSVRDLTEVAARNAGQRLDLVLPEVPVLVDGDPRQLDRAIANVVSNALKYSPSGAIVTLTLETVDDQVRVSCIDHGLGISEADQESLFREFFRSAHPEASSRGGSGLGLAIVERIVQLHGGRIEVDSTLGEGSTFRIVLPISAH